MDDAAEQQRVPAAERWSPDGDTQGLFSWLWVEGKGTSLSMPEVVYFVGGF